MPTPVVIDGRAAVRAQLGGVERYAVEMATRLPALNPERYRLVAPSPRLAHRAGHLWEQGLLPLLARGALVYCPANLAPVTSSTAVVLHDVAPLRFPAAFSRGYVAYLRRMFPLIARRARQVITVSEFSRQELVEVLGLDPAKIAVAPGGVGERYTPGADAKGARAALGLSGAYVLAVGTVSARKDLGALSEAAAALRAQRIELVLAGGQRSYLRGEVPDVRRLGYVPEALMPGLLAGASALVMPSRYEGFGLPCLEAMACGTPVVAAAAGALPEVCAGAALMVEAGDRTAFAQALESVIASGGPRDELISRGFTRAAELTWARTAKVTDQIFSTLDSDS